MTVTEIIKKEDGRCQIFVDDEYALTLDVKDFLTSGLKPGVDVTERELSVLLAKFEYRKAKEKALSFLSMREYSKKAMTDKLSERFDRRISAKVVEKLEEAELINDQSYGERLVVHFQEVRGFSRRRLRQELYKRGLQKPLIDELLEEEIDETELAYSLISSKYSYRINEENGRQKVAAALARQGFDYDDIRAAVSRFLKEHEETCR